MSKKVTFLGNRAEKRTDVVMRRPSELLEGGGSEAAGGRMLNIPLVVADWIIVLFCFVLFINSIDAPLPTCFFFFLTSCCSCYSSCCCFLLSSALLFLFLVTVVPSDEAVLRHRDTS